VAPYALVLHEDVARRLVIASRTEQKQVVAILDELKKSPFRKGDLQERDAHGRDNEILIAGDWLVTFWVDHAVREIRIVRLESVED
jgi:hypothetical protein